MGTLYFSTVFIQGSDEWDLFEQAAYPERDGCSLGFPDKGAALDFLISRVPDDLPEPDDSEIMSAGEYPRVHEGGCQNWQESDEWVACWDAGYGIAGLWRKEETTVRGDSEAYPDISEDDKDDPSEHAFECCCFLCIPGN